MLFISLRFEWLFFFEVGHLMNKQWGSNHIFVQQIWQKLHSPSPLLTEPWRCRHGPRLTILSISDSLAFRDGQCDMGLADNEQAEGTGWASQKGYWRGDSAGMLPFDLLPFPHTPTTSRMWYSAQKGSSHVVRRKTKSHDKHTRADAQKELVIHRQQGDAAEGHGCLQTSCLVIRNTPKS